MAAQTLTRFEGKGGWVQRVETPDEHPNAGLVVDTWYMHLPDQGLGWTEYVLAVTSLEDVEGRPPANLRYPEAEYELLVFAADPRRRPTVEDWKTWYPMEPINVCVQFHGVDRSQARLLAELSARACVELRLPAETQMYVEIEGEPGKMMTLGVARDAWARSVALTVKHLRDGGHHE